MVFDWTTVAAEAIPPERTFAFAAPEMPEVPAVVGKVKPGAFDILTAVGDITGEALGLPGATMLIARAVDSAVEAWRTTADVAIPAEAEPMILVALAAVGEPRT